MFDYKTKRYITHRRAYNMLAVGGKNGTLAIGMSVYVSRGGTTDGLGRKISQISLSLYNFSYNNRGFILFSSMSPIQPFLFQNGVRDLFYKMIK